MKASGERVKGSWRRSWRVGLYGAPLLIVVAFAGIAPRVDVSRNVVDIGVVRRGQFVQELVSVKNEGFRRLWVDSQARTCGVRLHTEAPIALVHGATTSVRLDIDTTLFPEGPSIKEISIPTNDPLNGPLLITVRATVRSDVSIAPRLLRLSPQERTAAARVQIVRSSDIEPISIRSTNPLVTARFDRQDSPDGPVLVVSAHANVNHMTPWDLGTIVIATTSAIVPEVRIPVRGVLP
jgi:hypothetical protein